jgi:predicted nucleic-acid-binding protein
MIAVDTNVLVRLLVGDDADQLRRVVLLLEQSRDAGRRWLVTAPVLCELVWVLGDVYAVPRREIAGTLETLLEEPLCEVEQRDAVEEAVGRYRRSRGDFADYLIAAVARRLGAEPLYTFDRALRREAGFVLL